MEGFGDWIFWIFLVLMFIVLVYVPRWAARRQRQRQEAELAVGDRVLTIGGLIGTLVYFNTEENIARLRLAEGVTVDILPGAISGKRVEKAPEEVEA